MLKKHPYEINNKNKKPSLPSESHLLVRDSWLGTLGSLMVHYSKEMPQINWESSELCKSQVPRASQVKLMTGSCSS